MTRPRESRVMRAIRERAQPGLTVLCEVGISVVHVLEAVIEEWTTLRARLRN